MVTEDPHAISFRTGMKKGGKKGARRKRIMRKIRRKKYQKRLETNSRTLSSIAGSLMSPSGAQKQSGDLIELTRSTKSTMKDFMEDPNGFDLGENLYQSFISQDQEEEMSETTFSKRKVIYLLKSVYKGRPPTAWFPYSKACRS